LTACVRTLFNTRLFDIFFSFSWKNHEAHFSAIRRTSQAHTWLSGPHAYARRQGGDPRAACKRARAARRLSRAERYRKAQRLGGEAIAQILAITRPRRSGSVSVQVRPNGLDYSRLGLVVPKRLLHRAVDRNRAKRLLREWFRRNEAVPIGQDLLVRLATRRSQLESLVADLERAFASER
jgi:ribonuclease P protein component